MSRPVRMAWRKSTRSANECIEVAFVGRAIHVRDTKDRTGPPLTFAGAGWRAFVEGLRRGQFAMR